MDIFNSKKYSSAVTAITVLLLCSLVATIVMLVSDKNLINRLQDENEMYAVNYIRSMAEIGRQDSVQWLDFEVMGESDGAFAAWCDINGDGINDVVAFFFEENDTGRVLERNEAYGQFYLYILDADQQFQSDIPIGEPVFLNLDLLTGTPGGGGQFGALYNKNSELTHFLIDDRLFVNEWKR